MQVNHVLAVGRFMLIVQFRSFTVCYGIAGWVNKKTMRAVFPTIFNDRYQLMRYIYQYKTLVI